MNKFEDYNQIKLLVEQDLVATVKRIENVLNSVTCSDEKFMPELSNYVLCGSKQLRSSLIFLFARMLNADVTKDIIDLAAAVEIIHNATLIHDDIIDESAIRRGKTALHEEFGNRLAVIAGDFLLSLSIGLLTTLSKNIIENFSCCLKMLCQGEIDQYFAKKQTPSIENYIEKSSQKTASLFIAALTSLAEIIAPQNMKLQEDVFEFSKHFGIAFQIRDDLKNLTDKTASKPVLNDIRNGIYTAPVIYAYGENKNLSDLLCEKILETAKSQGAIEKTKILIEQEINQAIKILNIFQKNEYNTALVALCNLLRN